MENQSFILNHEEPTIDNNIEEQKIISLWRFALLTVLSFGLYEIWWIYKTWRFYQQKDNSDINPAARAIFNILFINSLFEKILSFAQEKGYNEKYSIAGLATGFIVFNLIAVLPDPFWLLSYISVVFLIPPFKAFNFARLNSNEFLAKEQDSFNKRQIYLMVIGAIIWLLLILSFMVEE